MQNEILRPVLDTDEVAVPRYDIVGPNGSVIQQNVELRLKNEVVQEGTPYDEESVLPASLREQLELPQSATPAEAMAALLTKGGGAVRRNRPPLTTDADQVGKLWVVPEMFFNNLMPNALTQVAGNWQSSNAAVAVSGNTATFTGSGTENSVDAQVGMLVSAKAGDKVFVQATVKVNHDANAATIQLTCGEQTLANKALDVPAAGDTMLLQAVATVESGGALYLRVHSAYNTATVQSGKSVTVSAITVWNLTEDMCEAQEGNEFTEQEAANYISSFGQFQSKEYEYSTWWWVLRGVNNGQYLWVRRYDLATQQEAQGATDHTTLMTPLRTKQFLTKFTASQAEVNAGTDTVKLLTPATATTWLNSVVIDRLKNYVVEAALVHGREAYLGELTGRERNVVHSLGSGLAATGNIYQVGENAQFGMKPYNSSMSISQKAERHTLCSNYSGSTYYYSLCGVAFGVIESGVTISASAVRTAVVGYDTTSAETAFNVLDLAIVRIDKATSKITAVLDSVHKTGVSSTGTSSIGTTGTTVSMSVSYTTTASDTYLGIAVMFSSAFASNNLRQVCIPTNATSPSQGVFDSFTKQNAYNGFGSQSIDTLIGNGSLGSVTVTTGSTTLPGIAFTIKNGTSAGSVSLSGKTTDSCQVVAAIVEASSAVSPEVSAGSTKLTLDTRTETGVSANGTSCTRTICTGLSNLPANTNLKISLASSDASLKVYDATIKAI